MGSEVRKNFNAKSINSGGEKEKSIQANETEDTKQHLRKFKGRFLLEKAIGVEKINEVQLLIENIINKENKLSKEEILEKIINNPLAKEIFMYLVIENINSLWYIFSYISDKSYALDVLVLGMESISENLEAIIFFAYLNEGKFKNYENNIDFQNKLTKVSKILLSENLRDGIDYILLLPEPYAQKVIDNTLYNESDIKRLLFEYMDIIINRPYIKNILFKIVTGTNILVFFDYIRKSNEIKKLPYFNELIKLGVEKWLYKEPYNIFLFGDIISILPDSDEIFNKILPLITPKHYYSIFSVIDILESKSYAWIYIEKVINYYLNNDPGIILNNAKKIKKLKNGKNIIERAVLVSYPYYIITNCQELLEYNDLHSQIRNALKSFSIEYPKETITYVKMLRSILGDNIEDYVSFSTILSDYDYFGFKIPIDIWARNKYKSIIETTTLINAMSYFDIFEPYLEDDIKAPYFGLKAVLDALQEKEKFLTENQKRLTEKYGIRPRKYFGVLDQGGNTALTEQAFLKAVDKTIQFLNEKLKKLGYNISISKEELITNFLAEGGILALNSSKDSFSAFGDLGLDTYGDKLKYSKLLQELTPGDLKDYSKISKTKNEKGEEVSTYSYINLEVSVLLEANMYILKKYLFFTDAKKLGIDVSKLSDTEIFFWTTLYFNTGEGNGKKILEEKGINYINQRWRGKDDSNKFGKNPQYNALLRTSAYEFTKASLYFLNNIR